MLPADRLRRAHVVAGRWVRVGRVVSHQEFRRSACFRHGITAFTHQAFIYRQVMVIVFGGPACHCAGRPSVAGRARVVFRPC